MDTRCSFCKGIHDLTEVDACTRVLYPKVYAQMLESLKNRALANEAAKKRRYSTPAEKLAYQNKIKG